MSTDVDPPKATSARTLSAFFNVAVGLRLLLPDDILNANPGYRLLDQHFFGDIPFGLACLIFGVVMCFAIFTDYAPRKLIHAASWLSMITWLLVAFDISKVNISQFGSLVYMLVAALNAWGYWHIVERERRMRRNGRVL